MLCLLTDLAEFAGESKWTDAHLLVVSQCTMPTIETGYLMASIRIALI